MGSIYSAHLEEKQKNPAKPDNFIIKMADFNKEVDKLKKDPVFLTFAKNNMEDPKFSDNALNQFKKVESKKMSQVTKKSLAVLNYSLKLDEKYYNHVVLSTEKPLSFYYSTMQPYITSYTEDIMQKNDKLKPLVATALALREIEKEKGPNGSVSQYDLQNLKNKYEKDPALEKTMQAVNGISIMSDLTKQSKKDNFAHYFSEKAEEAYNKAVKDLNKTKAAEKNPKPDDNLNKDNDNIIIDNKQQLNENPKPKKNAIKKK